MSNAAKLRSRKRRHARLRQRIFGTAQRPRLNVYRSSAHIYAQIVDDSKGHTLVSASTLDAGLRTSLNTTGTIQGAKAVGKLLAERAKSAGVGMVVFDRGGRVYHGRIKALAEASREAGLQF